MSTNEMESKKQGWKVVDIAIATVGVAMAMYHMLSTQYLIFGGFQHQNVHLGFALALIFLVALKKSVGKARYYMFSLLVLGIICVTYIGINITALEARVGFNTTLDLVIGVAIVIVILESTRQSFGVILPLVTIIFMIYAFFGHYIPGPLTREASGGEDNTIFCYWSYRCMDRFYPSRPTSYFSSSFSALSCKCQLRFL